MSTPAVAVALAAASAALAQESGAPEPAENPPTSDSPPDPPHRVWLGVDCSELFVVSLPDDVLTECE